MNETIVENFIKKAQEAGIPQDQAEQFLVNNLPGYKTAAQQLNAIIGGILTHAGVETNSKTAAYVEGFLSEAKQRGATDEQAVKLAAMVCDAKRKSCEFPPIPNNTKKASASLDVDKFTHYAEGFMKHAQEAGMTEGQSLDLLKVAVANAKTAAGEEFADPNGGLDIQALLAQLLGQGQQGLQGQAGEADPNLYHQLMSGLGGQGQSALSAPGM